jgi:hypothetical protein
MTTPEISPRLSSFAPKKFDNRDCFLVLKDESAGPAWLVHLVEQVLRQEQRDPSIALRLRE